VRRIARLRRARVSYEIGAVFTKDTRWKPRSPEAGPPRAPGEEDPGLSPLSETMHDVPGSRPTAHGFRIALDGRRT